MFCEFLSPNIRIDEHDQNCLELCCIEMTITGQFGLKYFFSTSKMIFRQLTVCNNPVCNCFHFTCCVKTCSFIKPFQTGRCRFLFVLGRHTYITPTSYLELISSFITLITQKQLLTMESKQRYVTGLEKLAFAAATVCTISYCRMFTCRM